MASPFAENNPRLTLNIYLVTLLPIIASYVPFVILTILHLVVNTPLVQVIVRTIKISQFLARITPALLKLDPFILLYPHRVVWGILHAGYVSWSSRSWFQILCFAAKEVLKWNGVPQELFDTLSDVGVWAWFLGFFASAAPSTVSRELWTPTLDKPFLTNELAVGFSPAVGGLNVSG